VAIFRGRWVGVSTVGVVLVATLALGATRLVTFASAIGANFAFGLFAAAAAIAAVTYRDRRDPRLLLLAVGSAGVPLHGLILPTFLVSAAGWIGGFGPALISVVRFALPASLVALAVYLVLSTPWRDRRGRSPMRPPNVILATFGALAAFDIVVALARPSPPITTPVPGVFHLGPLAVALAIAVIVLATVGAVRALHPRREHPWIAGASAALGLFATTELIAGRTDDLQRFLQSTALQAVMGTLCAALILVGILASLRLETSRMRRATDRAEEVLGGRAEIASVIAHDVRSPVASIKSIAASTIANYGRLDDAQRLEFVGMIDRQAEEVLGVVHQMSVALKVDARSLELARRSTTIAAAVREAIDDATINGHEVRLEATPGITANVDGRWIAEAIRQAIDNAAAFSPEGAPIDVTVENSDVGVTVTVEDGGPGIPAERREAVFERFARWRPPGYEDVPGSGLGLFICRGIVREHGGDVTLDGAPEGGTILRISLPWGPT
jgi:signal transduction histidine kinase